TVSKTKSEKEKSLNAETAQTLPAGKSWWQFGLGKKEKPSVAVAKESAVNKPWVPFSFDKKKDTAKKELASPKKTWTPFSFEKRESTQATRQPAPKKQWKPLSFDKKESKVGPTVIDSQRKVKDSQKSQKKGWVPFNFEKKKGTEEGGANNE
ncbi:MAG: hypothetical protein NC933_04495, partial [Candidatus Omnitrophica bacterium]|nr:hypothetical protein [Candidatus Omnitrophota bacterium]